MVLVAREGMSTSQFFCSTVLQLVQHESHSEDMDPMLWPGLVCSSYVSLKAINPKQTAFDVSCSRSPLLLMGVQKKTAWKKLITPVRLIGLKSRCLAWSSETIVGNRFVSLAATPGSDIPSQIQAYSAHPYFRCFA